jgi:hypothetical protein
LHEVLLRLTNRDVLMGMSDRPAAEIIQSYAPVTLTAASYVKRQVYVDSSNEQYNKIEVAREAIAFAVDL